MEQTPVAGVDVSKRFSDMCILSPSNKVFAKTKIYHDPTSMQKSLEPLHQAESMFGAKPVIVMESTSHYHLLLCQFMRRAGYEVIVINPIQSGALHNINVRKVKNDKVDAYRIAMLYRMKLTDPVWRSIYVAQKRNIRRNPSHLLNLAGGADFSRRYAVFS